MKKNNVQKKCKQKRLHLKIRLKIGYDKNYSHFRRYK